MKVKEYKELAIVTPFSETEIKNVAEKVGATKEEMISIAMFAAKHGIGIETVIEVIVAASSMEKAIKRINNTNKELIEFANEYEAMRQKQKQYFATRDKEVLAESKRMEKELDKKAKDITNPNLFS